MKYSEFDKSINNVIYVSATPNDFEINQSRKIVEQIVRPTGLIDPEVIIRPINGKISQVDDLIERIIDQVSKKKKH